MEDVVMSREDGEMRSTTDLGRDDDDDRRLISSFFKIGRSRQTKRVRSSEKPGAVGSPRGGGGKGGDLGEVEDTLAVLKLKLRGSKKGKGGWSGDGVGESCPNRMADGGDVMKGEGREEMGGGLAGTVGFGDSLSSFVQQARSSSKRKVGNTKPSTGRKSRSLSGWKGRMSNDDRLGRASNQDKGADSVWEVSSPGNDVLDGSSVKGSRRGRGKALKARRIEETQRLEDCLKQCSNERQGQLGHSVVKLSMPVSEAGGEEAHGVGDDAGLNGPTKEIGKNAENRSTKQTCGDILKTSRDLSGLEDPRGSPSKCEQPNVYREDESKLYGSVEDQCPDQPFMKTMNELLVHTVSSESFKMGDRLKSGEFNQFSGANLEDSQDVNLQKPISGSGRTELEEIHVDDNSKFDDKLTQPSNGALSVFQYDTIKGTDFLSIAYGGDQNPDVDESLNRLSLGVSSSSPLNQPIQNASNEFSSVAYTKNAKETGCSSVLKFQNNVRIDEQIGIADSNKTVKEPVDLVRAVRKIKKRRHGDMAYEGDNDWEVLVHEQGFLENSPTVYGGRSTRTGDKHKSSANALANANDGGEAAIAAGLKAWAAGPIEKIKFKEVLKRKGGLQEYLECRNLILGLWSKDIGHILHLEDCGVTEAPLEDESPRESLIREIFVFLDHSGYINVGIASEKGKSKLHIEPSTEFVKETKSTETRRRQVIGSGDEANAFFGQLHVTENIAAPVVDLFSEYEKSSSRLDTELNSGKELPVPIMSSKSFNEVDPGRHLVENMEQDLPLASVDGTPRLSINDSNLTAPCLGRETQLETGSCNSLLLDVDIPCRDAQLNTLSTDLCNEAVDDIFAQNQINGLSCNHRFIENSRDKVNRFEVSRGESGGMHHLQPTDDLSSDMEVHKRIIIIGAGPSGLTAARHLQRQGFSVNVLEARDRIGGRVFTDHTSLSVPVDLGASIITGVEADVATERRADPSALICAQLGLQLTILNSDCPLYDIATSQKVPADLDEALEAEYNSLLDDMVVLVAHNGESAMRMSLEDGLEYALRRRRSNQLSGFPAEPEQLKIDPYSGISDADTMMVKSSDGSVLGDGALTENLLSPLERRVMDWHFANLEYGCAASLKEVSLPYWNQDDVYGGFGGPHCMIKGGYSTVVETLGKGLNIHLNQVVTEIAYNTISSGAGGEWKNDVKVITSNGSIFVGDAVLITVPLGCLKASTIKFSPDLPEWKNSSIQRLGFGVLNKVVLEFAEVFWDDSVDYFGATAEETNCRGQCFMFWNVKKTVGAPVLIALVVGKAAINGQNMNNSYHITHAVMVLRKIFGEASVPDPVASVVTNWGRDPFSRGAYSYVAVGASGEDYDILGRPVANCLFFAGEATCKEHPDTVGGAMMSGLREAVRIIDIFNTGNDHTAEVEAIEAAQRQSDSERNEVRDLAKRLDACKLSNVLCKSSLDGGSLTKEALLQDMFFYAKTNAGRLHLIKELLRLPVEVLKSFAGTKEGLCTLNSWILDSLGKNATQLLRHCVRLLVLVSTDLLAVRLSGIGRTVKEKVCVHTSRDIRAVASQLVSVWVEIFRKEKASNGLSKVLRQTSMTDSSRMKSKDTGSGKPPIRAIIDATDCRVNLHSLLSDGSHSPSGANNKKSHCRPPAKLETLLDTKSDISSSRSRSVPLGVDSKTEDNTAYASSGGHNSSRELPKIPSFHKYARREQYAQMDESELRRRRWLAGGLGRQDCISEIDSRNCKVRNWSVDFSATCGNLNGPRMLEDIPMHQSYSNELGCHLNLREHSGESGAVESRLTKAWVDSDTAGSGGVKDYLSIERWQAQAIDADADFYNARMYVKDEEDSTKYSNPSMEKHEGRAEESSVSQTARNKVPFEANQRGAEHIKQGVVDYVASLLMPLYKARRFDKDGYKSIMKKSATKVMEQCTDVEKMMTVPEFLDFKRKNKIRAFVDKLIERHMAMRLNTKS
ncbi:hypothetical protein QJS10_CPB11g00878 [Acorus calamus]|uniref:SWIRM domain-containing protein n=1 Tax=Acorus calamus TaxID=4465 RepID=A0AAV9DQC6_ACOCL|nr:hypothetical protein QJS10_CPB11g00878 [Acorus calamus]